MTYAHLIFLSQAYQNQKTLGSGKLQVSKVQYPSAFTVGMFECLQSNSSYKLPHISFKTIPVITWCTDLSSNRFDGQGEGLRSIFDSKHTKQYLPWCYKLFMAKVKFISAPPCPWLAPLQMIKKFGGPTFYHFFDTC